MKDLWDFNEIFRQNMTFNNIKIHKKAGLQSQFSILEKPPGEGGSKTKTFTFVMPV